MNNYKKNIIIPAIISVIPFTLFFLLFNFKTNITSLISYYFLFKVFYLFCFSIIFNLNNKKNILITFIIFLLTALASFYIPNNTNFIPNDIIHIDNNSRFLLHAVLNKNLFLYIIFFIIFALSYNGYKDYKNISEVFTFAANTMIFSLLFFAALSFISSAIFLIVISLLKDFIIKFFSDTSIILNIFILLIFYIFALSPFIIFGIYKKDIKNNNISIFLSRIMMYISLYNIIKYLFSMIIPYNNPYDIRINFILYNIALSIAAVNLFFVRIDYKSSILTKLVYLIFPIIAIIFNIIIFTSLVYRIKEYGISPNKLTLIGTNLMILFHFALILFDNIKSLRKLNSIKNIKYIVITNNRSYYVYIYGILAFIVCFVIPLLY
ncbi:hypothetical protein [uncultured Brachyspira sp.]|uniref:hypothetical protein n=1 Tax=uncultured Brachyspira sp. TaxID=221953 RepID=UPI00260C7834|nr:hypothetical protein [uncultured Brachyspira sp.]